MEGAHDRSPDVERAARRLARPALRIGLTFKRTVDVVLSLVMLIALLPVLLVVVALLTAAGDGWFEERVRLGRHGRPVSLVRFRALRCGSVGRALEAAGVCELPLLVAVLCGRVSFIGPRLLPPGTGAGHTGPRRLMAPGLTGPAQQFAQDAATAARLDDAYVQEWSPWRDVALLLHVRRRADHTVSDRSS